MKEIKLTQNKVALVDDEDYEFLSKFNWYAGKGSTTFYAKRSETNNGKKIVIKMHHQIMGGKWIDHVDHNGLNNQRSNLRFCTRSQNGMNQRKQKNTSSIYKGVYFHKSTGKWMSRININGNRIHLGMFDSELDAAIVYNENAIKLFKEFASINVIPNNPNN